MKAVATAILVLTVVCLGVLTMYNGALAEPSLEEYYGPAIRNGRYAQVLGERCAFVVSCPGAPPTNRRVEGVPIAEYRDVLVVESQGGRFVFHKPFIESFTSEAP